MWFKVCFHSNSGKAKANRWGQCRHCYCHRSNKSIWEVLFKQSIHLSRPIQVTRVTKGDLSENFCFTLWGTCIYYLIFWIIKQSVSSWQHWCPYQKSMFFTWSARCHDTAIGNQPHCLHPATVEFILLQTVSSRYDINFDNGEYVHLENSIRKGNKNVLYDTHILPRNDVNCDTESFKKFYFICKGSSNRSI